MMAARTVVSYDDITLPYDQPEEPVQASKPSGGQPPPKKRKKNNQKAKHWDNSSNAKSSASYSQRTAFENDLRDPKSKQLQDSQIVGEDQWDAAEGEGEYDEEEESRNLTHEEIWDDSALVDAWESAMEEYKAYHDGEDGWKKEPVKKSPLWYNVPVDPSKKPAKGVPPTVPTVTVPIIPTELVEEEEEEEDSQPLNFDTFVPTHDASLQTTQNVSNPVATDYIPDTPAGPMVSQDEAFSRALSAMYWGGYWTAMYHAQRQTSERVNAPPTMSAETTDADAEDVGENKSDDEVGEFTSTQR